MNRTICVIFFVLLSSFSRAADADKPIKVDFINAIPAHNQFWDNLVGAMQTAAQQLGIDFTNRVAITPEEMVSEATRLVKGPERPDYLIVTANWFREQAKIRVPLILKRYPDTKVIWVANDAMALGVITALEELGRNPGKDIFVGGIDWDDDAVKAVADGKLVATIGGHFLEGAWAMVLLCDHYHGIDFASERIDWRSEMLPLTKETVGNYLKYFGTGHWRKIDFRQFSKFYNRDLKTYNFSLETLLAEPKAAEAKP